MSLAIQLAAKGKYGVGTNPMVGCVITKDDEIIATDITKPMAQIMQK